MNRSTKLFFAAAAAVALAGQAAAAYPEKTVNYIIAFGPGGESDVSARLQEPFFRKLTNQTVAIQYKAGAGGAATWSQLNGMPADGYTIVGTNLPTSSCSRWKRTSATRPTTSTPSTGFTTRRMPSSFRLRVR